MNLVGTLDLGAVPLLLRALRGLHRQAPTVVVDLRHLVSIDGFGVRAIVEASLRARRRGRRLVLVRGRLNVEREFERIGLSRELEICDLRLGEPLVQVLLQLAEREAKASSRAAVGG